MRLLSVHDRSYQSGPGVRVLRPGNHSRNRPPATWMQMGHGSSSK